MAGKARTVYFYTGIEYDQNEQPCDWKNQDWRDFIRNLGKTSSTLHINGSNCTGEAKSSIAPAAEYFHLMRERALSDWPEGKGDDGSVGNLGEMDSLGLREIYEYAYLLPIDGTPYVAMFRSSGGPRPGMIENWIAAYSNMTQNGKSFKIAPVLRKNAVQRLRDAVGVKAIYARFEGEIPSNSGSKVQDAAVAAASIPGVSDYADTKIDIVLSLGRAVKTGPGVDGLLKETNQILNSALGGSVQRGVTKLVATTLQKRDDQIVTEPVDFIEERMTISTTFGNSANDVMTPEEILNGMYTAIRDFRQRTGEYSY